MDNPPFDDMTDGLSGGAETPEMPRDVVPLAAPQIGEVVTVAEGNAKCRLSGAELAKLADHDDLALRMSGQVGSQLKLKVQDWWIIANVRSCSLDVADRDSVLVDIDFMGEGRMDEDEVELHDFRRGITRFPTPGAPVYAVTDHDLQQIFSPRGRPHIIVGTVYPTKDVNAALFVDPMLSRHFALLGSTGTGKSTTTALLMHRLVEKMRHGHIVMLDPHGEYAAAFADTGVIYDVENIAMPYWLLNFEEHAEVIVQSEGQDREIDRDILSRAILAARAKSRLAGEIGKLSADTPIPYLLSDLVGALTAEMGKLDKAERLAPYIRLKSKLDDLKSDPRYAFMFSGLLVSDTFGQFLQRIFRMQSDGRPISIIDLSGVPSDIVNVVVAVISRLIFDFAMWARSEPQRPILLVCEEAHRYVPAERLDTFGPARLILERIAKEGRKYGVSLALISQRPSDLSESVLSQCGTIISMRMNNERDQAFVRSAMPEGARGFLESIPSLRNRECIICGEGVAIPIRAKLDDLAPALRPSSDDPIFSALWRRQAPGDELVKRVVQRWRAQKA